jgi:formylmethanofuran dehydrogenase subunit C
VSETVTLSLRAPLTERLEVGGLTADRVALLSEKEIAALAVWAGGREARLGDFFTVTGERALRMRLEGDLSRAVGIGAGMSAGSIDVEGSVGDEAGIAMAGGTLRISGNAGDRLGAATPGASRGMTGGEIVVLGSAGREAAARARRGLVVVGGDTGADAARDIIAGTLVVLGRTGANPGLRSKRGSIVAIGGIDVPSTYRYACTFEPPHLRLTLTYLRRKYGIAVDERAIAARYRRYCGDLGEPGKGEILEVERA